MSKQGERIAETALVAGTSPAGYEQTFHAAADAQAIPAGSYNGRLVPYLQSLLGSSNTSLPGLQAERAAFEGASSWNGVDLAGGFHTFTFNGTDQYATMDAWDTFGVFASYADIHYNGDAGFIEEVAGVAEFGRIGAAYYTGIASNLYLTDNSPLQDRNVFIGDGTDNILALDSTASSPGTTWTLEFDYIRQDSTAGAGVVTPLGDIAGGTTEVYLSIYDTDHATKPDRIEIGTDSAFGFTIVSGIDNALAGIPVGKQCHLKVVAYGAPSNIVEFFLDGVSLGNGDAVAGKFRVRAIGNYESYPATYPAETLPANGAVANVSFSYPTGGWGWVLDENDGDVVGTASGDATAIDGTWEDFTNLVLPNNSRHYPMNEGSGITLADVIGGHDATIINPASPGGGWN